MFAYTDAPNYYVTYRLSSGGSIIKEDLAYIKYNRLTVEGNPLYETLAFAVDVLNSKVDGFDPLPPWVQVGLTVFPSVWDGILSLSESLPGDLALLNYTIIKESESDRKYREGWIGIY